MKKTIGTRYITFTQLAGENGFAITDEDGEIDSFFPVGRQNTAPNIIDFTTKSPLLRAVEQARNLGYKVVFNTKL